MKQQFSVRYDGEIGEPVDGVTEAVAEALFLMSELELEEWGGSRKDLEILVRERDDEDEWGAWSVVDGPAEWALEASGGL